MKDIIIRINENMEKLSDNIKQINDFLVLENKLLSERFKRGSNDSIRKEGSYERGVRQRKTESRES
jgi:hypothetical protein